MHEYLKNGYNFANAKLVVLNRIMEIDKIKERNDKLKDLQKNEEIVMQKVDEVLTPTEISAENSEELLEITFTAYLTKELAVELKKWFSERGVRYV